MNILQVVLAPFVLLLWTGWSTGAMNPNVAPKMDDPARSEVVIVRTDFGVVNLPESGKPTFVSTKEVPMIENQGYGWIIQLETKKPRIRWREEFTLPSAPATWGDRETQKNSISGDGRVSVIEREVEPEDGLISNFWSVAPGDPKGRYVIRVIIEDTLERVFEFEVK